MTILESEVKLLLDEKIYSAIAISGTTTEHIEQALLKAKECLIMELLRLGDISAGKAAEMLGIDRLNISQLMYQYNIPAWNWNDEDWEQELINVDQELERLITV